jgi:hypothetical protein
MAIPSWRIMPYAASRAITVLTALFVERGLRVRSGTDMHLIGIRAKIMAVRLVVAAGAVLTVSGLTPSGSGASSSSSIALFGIDAAAAGNSARNVGAMDRCVSASVGAPLQIDIVVPAPGVPTDRGISAYQFTVRYDPAVIWIGADDGKMLLAAAAGSNVISIADPKPDKNGVYESWGADFGPSGIEPAGSSEAGPGVIAGITLLPQREGASALTLTDVLVIDDASSRISLASFQYATINVGEPCSTGSATTGSGPSPTAKPASPVPSPTARPASAVASPTARPAFPVPSPTGGSASSAASPPAGSGAAGEAATTGLGAPEAGPTSGAGGSGVGAAPRVGGAPIAGYGQREGSDPSWVPVAVLTIAGLLAVVGGLLLLISYMPANSSKARRH